MPPPAGYLWFIPGLLGSELYAVYPGGGRRKVWLDVPSLLRGDTANTLTFGAAPPGVRIVPGGLLDFAGYGYPGLQGTLSAYCAANNLQFQPWPYDWRNDVLSLGNQLAADMWAVSPNGPHAILAHSLGGLVASAAMMAMFRGGGRVGPQFSVNSVVTLGSPLSGSYSPCATFRVDDDTLNVFALFAGAGRAVLPLAFGVPGLVYAALNPPPGVSAFLNAFVSWPSVYDLLPNPDLVDNPGDVYRADVWNPAKWASAWVQPNAQLMALSSGPNGWQRAAGQGNAPAMSAWFLCIAGTQKDTTPMQAGPAYSPQGYPPLGRASLRDRANQCPSIQHGSDGDGTVNTASAFGVGRWGTYRIAIPGASHENLATHPLIVSNLSKLVNIPAVQGWPRSVTLTLPNGSAGPSVW